MTEKSFKDKLNDAEGIKDAKVVPIVTGVENISTSCENATIEEAEQLWSDLEATLDATEGYGLTANQIGVNKRVAFIKYSGKTYRLLNTKIVEISPTIIIHDEGCLSLPKKTVNTERYHTIVIEDDILGRVQFTMSKDGLLPVIFQHEIDHMNGKTIFDVQRQPFRRNGKKIGRNAPCPCGSGKKYKNCCLKSDKAK